MNNFTFLYNFKNKALTLLCAFMSFGFLQLSATIDPELTSEISNITDNNNGTFEVEYTFVLTNNGTDEMCNVSLTNDFQSQFACAFGMGTVNNPVVTFTTATGGSSNIFGNVNFDGTSANDNLVNPLPNGCLFPGDVLEVVVSLTVDPTCTGVSSPLQVLAQVQADEPSDPGNFFFDNSDDTTDMNVDGTADNETGGNQDPTDLYLPVLSAVKSVEATTTLPNGNVEVSYRMALKNIGNANMSNISMTDNMMSQLGAAYLGLSTSSSPNINLLSSTATTSPILNTAFDGMGNDDVFSGAGTDMLEIGQEIVVEIVVEIDPNLASWPLTNQATAEANALDKNNMPVFSMAAVPFAASDETDSGQDFQSSNPNEPGDLGSENDATPLTCDEANIVITTDDSEICEGESASLTVSSDIPGATFQWNEMGSTTVISTSDNPTFSDLATDMTYEVVMQVPSGQCVYNLEMTQVITVNPSPVIDAEAFYTLNSDCSPSDLSFEGIDAAGANFDAYQWTGPNNWSSTVSNPVIPNAEEIDNGQYMVQVTDSNGCTAEEALQVTDIRDSVMEPVIGSSGPACEGEVITLDVANYVGSSVTYTWTTPGGISNDISGFGTNELVLSPVASAQAGTYTLDLDVDGCLLSADFEVTVEETPIIDPQFITVDSCAGGSYEFTSNATGVDNLSYAWQGPNGFSSTLPNPNLNNADVTFNGQYALEVTSAAGCVAVDFFEIENILPEPTPPSINTNGPEICDGEPIELSTSGAGDQFEWISTSDSQASLAQTGMTTTTTNTSFGPGHPEYQDGPWRVRVTDANGCVAESETINMQINPIPESVPTNSGPVCDGDDLNLFSSVVNGASFQWYNGDPAMGAILVSTDQNTMITDLSPGAYTYFLQVELDGCFSEAVPTMGTIGEEPSVSNDFIYMPNADCSASDVQLNAVATPGSNPVVSYEWVGPDGFASVESNPMIDNANSMANGSYTVIVTDEIGCTASSIIEVDDVTDPLADTPVINSSGPACESGEVILSTQFQGGTNVTYAWTVPGTTNTITGLNTNELIITQTDAADHAGAYTVTVNVDDCEVVSEDFVVEIGEAPTVDLDFEYIPNLDCSSTNVDFDGIAVAGSTPIESYFWTGPNGFTSIEEDPVIANAGSINNGSYVLTVTDEFGCTATNTLQVEDIVDGLVSNPIINTTGPACRGDEIILTTELQDGVNVTYTWTTPNGMTNITGEGTNELILSVVNDFDHEGNYTVTVNVDGCEVESLPFFVDVFDDPLANPSTTTPVICYGDALDLNAELQPDVVSYFWTGPNGFTSSVQNPVINSVDPTFNGEYTLTVTSITGCTSSSTLEVLTILDELEPASIVSVGPHCEGDDLTFTTSADGVQFEWVGPMGSSANTLATAGLTTTAGETTFDPNHPAYMSGTWQVNVIDNNGCEVMSNAIDININEIPVALPDNDSDVCEGTDVQLLANTFNNSTYNWYDADPSTGGNLISTNEDPVLFSPAAGNTDYYLVVERFGCFSEAVPTTVIVNALPEIDPVAVYNLNPDCSLSNLGFNANSTGATPFEYSWTGPNGFISTDEDPVIPDVRDEANGSYVLSVIDENGCETFASVEVADITDPVAQPVISSSGPACDNGLVVLTTPTYAGSVVTYTWTTPNGDVTDISGVNTNEITISPVDTTIHEGDYVLTVDVDGCVLSSTAFNLEIFSDPPAAMPAAIDFGICEGEDILLTSPFEDEYFWQGPNGFSSDLQNPAIGGASMSDAGTYTLTVVNEQGCVSDPVSINIDVTRRPESPTIVAENPQICRGEFLSLRTSTECAEYQWIGPGGNSTHTLGNIFLTTTTNETAIPVGNIAYESGLWSVVCVNEFGCASEMSAPVNVSIIDFAEPVPVASADLVCGNEPFQLFAGDGYDDGTQFSWYNADPALGGSLIANTSDPVISEVTGTGLMTYWLSITQNGCTSVAAPISVEISPSIDLTAANDGTECVDPRTDVNLFSSASAGVAPFTYEWTGPNGFASIAQNPMLPNASNDLSGTYVVVVTDDNGCSVEAETVLDVTVIPDEPFLDYTGQECMGEDISIEAPAYEGFDVVYEWTGPNGTTSNGIYGDGNIIVLQDVGLSANGIYTVSVTVDGCTSEISQALPLEINDIPTVSPTNDGAFCVGVDQNLSLISNVTGGEGPYTYEWTGPNGFNSNAANPNIPNAGDDVSGTYTLFVVDANGCHSETMTTLVDITDVPATPSLVVSEETICEGSNLFLETQVYSGSDVVYNWVFANGSSVQSADPFLMIDEVNMIQHDGLITVFVSVNGCDSEIATEVNVQVDEAPEAPSILNSTTVDAPACEGEDIQLNTPIIPGATYAWTGPNGFSSDSPNPSIINASLEDIGQYTLVLTMNGCSSELVLTDVFVQATPETPLVSNAGPYCVGEDLELSVLDPEQNVTYNWFSTFDNTLVGSGSILILSDATIADQGGYYVIAESGACGSGNSLETIIIVDVPSTEDAFAGDDQVICTDATTLTAIELMEGEGFWSMLDADNESLIANPEFSETIVTELESGENVFIWSIISGACGVTSTDTVSVTVNEEPVAIDDGYEIAINEMLTESVLENDEVNAEDFNITIISTPANGTLEFNDDGSFVYIPNENFVGTDEFLYEICHTHCEENCVQAMVIFRIGEDADCFAPNLFTPNDDNLNDNFVVPCLANFPGSRICVFNRWGDQVFLEEDYQNDWNGTFQGNGESLPVGTYYYVINVNDGNDTTMTGYIFIQR